MTQFPDIMTVEQAAEYLQLTADTVRRLLREGQLPGRRIGKEWRLSRRKLEEFIMEGKPRDTTPEASEGNV